MAGTNAPVGRNGPLPPFWNAVAQGLIAQRQSLGQTIVSRNQGLITDPAGNAIEVFGSSLAAVVTIGAVYGSQAGVQVSTGITAADLHAGLQVGGRLALETVATGTITVTQGATTATLDSTISGAFVSNMQIGAANVNDPTSGIATPAITPGTTMTISGTTITLSQNAAESGTAIYCAACTWNRISG